MHIVTEHIDDKERQFERLWHGETPKGHNRTKMLKFRQYMLEHVRQLHIPEREKGRSIHKKTLKRNPQAAYALCKKYWMGQLKADLMDQEF